MEFCYILGFSNFVDKVIHSWNREVVCLGHVVHLSVIRALPSGLGTSIHGAGIRKAVRHARMAHKATKWPIIKILTGPVMRPDRTKLVKYKLFCEKDFNL